MDPDIVVGGTGAVLCVVWLLVSVYIVARGPAKADHESSRPAAKPRT